ncbi:YEATS-associated helix-containing protein [Pseudomaricurvus sp.]|uniref:YEATS-associated helix-containing protein n=1 Tax=Pseudomaricurvus sp. TaxID=2004510 RepID=UPI003F6D1582
MGNHIFILAAIMLVSGIFGGLINYYQMNQNTSDSGSLPRCIVIGIGASFLVPVILDFVNSDLILEIQGDPSRLLIYTGFCLIAAIAARVVIVNTSDRILREATLARAQSEAAQQELRVLRDELLPLVEAETEQDAPLDDGTTPELDADLDETAQKTLKSLASERYTFRSLAGLSRQVGTEETATGKALAQLSAKELVGKVSGLHGIRWYLTEKGRRMADLLV